MPIIRTNGLLAALSPHDLSVISFNLKDVEIQAGVALHEVAQPVERVYFPHEGVVSLQVVTSDGACVEAGVIANEGGVGLRRGFGKCRAFSRAVVHVGGRFSVMPGDKFERACAECVALRDMMLRYHEYLYLQAQQIAACNACHNTESRFARWLLLRSDLVGRDAIPATQETLAQILCVRRTTITLIAHEMQAAGVIRYRRGLVQIVDRRRLEERACGCYQALQDMRAITSPDLAFA